MIKMHSRIEVQKEEKMSSNPLWANQSILRKEFKRIQWESTVELVFYKQGMIFRECLFPSLNIYSLLSL